MAAGATVTDRCTQYALDVVAGVIIAGEYVRLACQRHLTFVLTFVIFWMFERQSEKEEREKELFPEYYEEQETKQDRIMVKLTFFILSVLVAVIWIGVPFILAFIFIMSVIDDSGDKKQKEEKK